MDVGTADFEWYVYHRGPFFCVFNIPLLFLFLYFVSIQCRYLNRASHFLPIEPCYEMVDASTTSASGQESVNLGSDHGSGSGSGSKAQSRVDWNGTSGPPSALAPLSVLCVAGTSNSLSLYLHGRYRIATIGPPSHARGSSDGKECDNNVVSSTSTQIVCAPDLSAVLLVPSTGPMILYDLPQLSLRHYELSWISSSYSFVAANVYMAYSGLNLAASGWKDAIRPLEAKLSSLKELLRQYGILSHGSPATVRAELLNYMILGNCSTNIEGSAEALIQFFANLSEFALLRMAKTVESGIASVESRIRSSILSSAQALVYAASELYGLARSSAGYSCEGEHFLKKHQAQQALHVSERLCIMTDQCLADIVRVRHSVRDMFAWMVWEVLCVKAEGTALDSHERKQAISKRPPQVVHNRVAAIFSDARSLEDPLGKRGETENILGIHLSVSLKRQLSINFFPEHFAFQPIVSL